MTSQENSSVPSPAAAKVGPSMGFRDDINGLRAWAVVAVVLFHFRVAGFGGGFVGVDVFFVISGFLMTGIVIRGLERGDFSLNGFYLARARRILPALVAMCVVLCIAGWWILIPVDLRALGSQVVYSVSFISNITFWADAGYFDVESHEKWLLHTWSLSVEWQFYLLLPVSMLLLWKVRAGRWAATIATASVFIASLILCVAWTHFNADSAFFLLPMRAWEMLAGGLVFLLPRFKSNAVLQSRLVEITGLSFIALSVILFDASSAWPGWRALLPVAGAALVIAADRSPSIWTGNVVAQWLGTRSYSIYLWHWPVVVALGYVEKQGDSMAVALGLGATLLLAEASYRTVETPSIRHLGALSPRMGAIAVVVLALCVAVPGAAFRLSDGVPTRVDPALRQAMSVVSQEMVDKHPRIDECFSQQGGVSPSCMHGGKTLRAILLGDSHSNAVVSALQAAAPSPQDGVMEWSYIACPILEGAHSARVPDTHCSEFVDWALQRLKAHPNDVPVVIVNRHSQFALGQNESSAEDHSPTIFFSKVHSTPDAEFLQEYSQHLVDTACGIAKHHPVYLVRPIPEMGVDVPKTIARGLMFGRATDVSIALSDYHQRQKVIWAAQDAARAQCGVKILDPLPYLCHDGRCAGARNGRPIYFDDDHLSEYGNKLLVPMFAEVFKPTP